MTPALAELPVGLTVLGAVAGSFTATAVIRSLRHEQATTGRSACDHCGATLAYTQTLPLVSYVLHRGACRTCAGAIDPLHPWGEAIGALIGLSTGLLFTVGLAGPVEAFGLVALGFSLLTLSLVDLRTQRIPDALTGVVLLAGLVLATSAGRLGPDLAWAAGCFGLLSVARLIFRRVKGEPGLGFGDVKLLSALAVWLGPLTPYALIAACVVALCVRLGSGKLGGRAAFGPWIALGAWTAGLVAEVVPWPV